MITSSYTCDNVAASHFFWARTKKQHKFPRSSTPRRRHPHLRSHDPCDPPDAARVPAGCLCASCDPRRRPACGCRMRGVVHSHAAVDVGHGCRLPGLHAR